VIGTSTVKDKAKDGKERGGSGGGSGARQRMQAAKHPHGRAVAVARIDVGVGRRRAAWVLHPSWVVGAREYDTKARLPGGVLTLRLLLLRY